MPFVVFRRYKLETVTGFEMDYVPLNKNDLISRICSNKENQVMN